MPDKLYYNHLCFESDLVFARTSDQKKIKFSKHERALLNAFIRRSGQILSREYLIDSIAQENLETLDRNVDYLISRLRRKLDDSARDPKFIATQYGEGYLWIAKPKSPPVVDKNSIYLSVGPVFGLTKLGIKTQKAEKFLSDLLTALQHSFGHQRKIELAPVNHNLADQSDLLAHQQARYALEISFLELRNRLTCSMVVLDRKTGQIFGTFRCNGADTNEDSQEKLVFKQLADSIRNKIWEARIFRTFEQGSSTDEPLVIGMYNASRLLSPDTTNLQEVEIKLRDQLKNKPSDAHTAIMLAANLHTQLLDGLNLVENPEEKLPEIESLIFDHLVTIQNDPLYLSFAAEQLYLFGHRDLGKSMAERALDIGPSYAACYMVIGRMHVTQGNFEEGLSYYDYCQEMTETDSTFYTFLQTMKCIAYKASNDAQKVRELTAYLTERETDPGKKILLQVFLVADEPQMELPSLKQFVGSLPPATISKAIKVIYYAIIRAFIHETHRENLFRDSIKLITEIHGEDVVPEEIRRSVPGLFATEKTKYVGSARPSI